MSRAIPLIHRIRARWNRREHWLDVPMSDGETVRYYPEIQQPGFLKSLEIIRHMKEEIVGYEMEKTGGSDAPTGQ